MQGAKLDRRVAVVENRAVIGGVCTNTGTIPSNTLRAAVMHLSGYRCRELYGASNAVNQHTTMDDLLFRADRVLRQEIDVTRLAILEVWLAERLRR
jgi:NAD(P) transhydrogenase